MIGGSKNNRENYPSKCFWKQEKGTRVNFNPGLSTDRPSNNWALIVLNTWKISLLKSSYPKNTTTQKTPQIKNFKPKHILWSSLLLEIWSNPPPPPGKDVHIKWVSRKRPDKPAKRAFPHKSFTEKVGAWVKKGEEGGGEERQSSSPLACTQKLFYFSFHLFGKHWWACEREWAWSMRKKNIPRPSCFLTSSS